MSRRQLPRASATLLDAATFLPGEIAVDTTNDELRYDGDGSTVGGIALARKDGTNLTAGPSLVTATGSTTARTLAARFAEKMTVLDFGAVGDCTAVGVGTDDAAAIQLAFDWLDAASYRRLVFPEGLRFRVGATCTADWGGGRGGQLIMESPITPDVDVGNAFELLNGYDMEFKLWVREGGADADYSQADPTGAQQAFVIRGIRGADIDVKAYKYLGRVVRTPTQTGSEPKTSMLRFHSFHTSDFGSGNGCGQPIRVDASTAFGTFGLCNFFWDKYGPHFYETSDIYIHSIDAGWSGSAGMVVEGCASFWCASLGAGGDQSTYIDIVTIKSSSTPTYSGNIWFGTLFAQYGTKGVKLVNVGANASISSIVIDNLVTRNCTQHGLYMDTCSRVKINYSSQGDQVSLETTNACSGFVHLNSVGSQVGAVILGASANNMVLSGRIKTPNASSTSNTDAITVNSTGDITFRDVSIEGTLIRYGYNLTSGNKVKLDGGAFNVSGGAVAFGTNLPIQLTGRVEGYRSGGFTVVGSGAALSHTGDTSKTALATVVIPAGAMGTKGRLRIATHWTITGSTNSKTTSYEFGGTAFFSVATTSGTTVGYDEQREIVNQNSASSQLSLRASSIGPGGLTNSTSSGSVNTANEQNLVFYATLANSGETITLDYYCVELLYVA